MSHILDYVDFKLRYYRQWNDDSRPPMFQISLKTGKSCEAFMDVKATPALTRAMMKMVRLKMSNKGPK